MSAAHTPGPWVVNPLMLNQIATADAAHEVAQATVLHPPAVTVANARLIAAAPEMLAALKAALAELERSNRVMRQEAGVTVCNEAVLQQVREAIAKAVTA